MMPSTTASGSVAMVDSEPITNAVRMHLSDWYRTSLPVVSVPNTWYAPISDSVTPLSVAMATSVHRPARQGMSPSLRHTLAAVSRKPAWRARASAANSAAAQAAASSRPSARPVPTREVMSTAHWWSGSDRCAPPCFRRGETRWSWPLMETVSRR